jgi:hypothetical protein
VSIGFAYLTTFSNPFREARVIYNLLPTICMYFLYCNFHFECIVEEILYLFFFFVPEPP